MRRLHITYPKVEAETMNAMGKYRLYILLATQPEITPSLVALHHSVSSVELCENLRVVLPTSVLTDVLR